MIQLDFSKSISIVLDQLNVRNEQWIIDIADFIKEWNNQNSNLEVKTSGTTGKAKTF